MKVAIPVWQSRVSPVFDAAQWLYVFEIRDGKEVSRTQQPIWGLSASGRVNRLNELGVNVLLCGAISRPLADMIATADIKVVPWLAGDINEVLGWYMAGSPMDSRFLMPGCGRRGHRFRGRGRRGLSRNWAKYPEENS